MSILELQEKIENPAKRRQHLINISIQEFIEAFGWQDHPLSRGVGATLAQLPARRFADSLLTYETILKQDGLAAAGAYLLNIHTRQIEIVGQEQIPPEGPLLFVSNHPGITDSVALFRALPRDDIRILARRRELLLGLPETSRRLIFLSDDGQGQFKAMRQVIRHLKQGGALLNFPAGKIEPDPALFPDEAVDGVGQWAESIRMFAKLDVAPMIVPIMVSGVVSAKALNHPLVRWRKERAKREWLAANLQVIWPPYRGVTVRVCFGEPIQAAQVLALPSREAVAGFLQRQVAALVPALQV